MSMHTYLIDKHFLSTFLSEETDELSEEFTNLALKENIELSDISDFLVRLEGTEVNDNIKLSYINRLARVYSEQVDKSYNEAIDVFQEYAGNAQQNRILIQLMSEMEKNLNEFYDDTLTGIKALNQMVDVLRVESGKKDSDAKAAGRKILDIYKKIDAEFSAANGRKQTYGATFRKLKEICSKFGVKFSDVAMEDKKAFDIKLKKAFDKMAKNKEFTNWMANSRDGSTPKIVEANSYLEELRLDNRDVCKIIVGDYIQPVYNYTYDCMVGYMGNINYLRQILGLEKEHTIFYKAINKLFKTKKDKPVDVADIVTGKA